MLRRPVSIVLLLATLLGTGACRTRHVDPRPSTEVRRTDGQSLRLVNAGATSLEVVMPRLWPSGPRINLAPGEEAQLPFVLMELTNRSPAGELEILPVSAQTSPFLGWSTPDLVLQLKFGAAPVEEVRVAVGHCVFERRQAGKSHELRLASPPLPGVPALRLCE